MKQEMDQVRIFITDSEAVYRKGIRWALSEIDGFEVIGEASTNMVTLERVLKTPADLLILNTNHDKPSGIDVTRYISHKLPDVKVVLMMDEYHTEHVVGAMKSGAKACFSKSINLDDLIQIVNRVVHHDLPISYFLLKPEVADFILEENEVSTLVAGQTDRARIGLVKSEQMILDKIRGNISTSELISGLGISREVLIEYLDEIVEKLVKTEYYNETPEQIYINNLITRHFGRTAGEINKHPGDRGLNIHTGEVGSIIADNFSQNTGVRLDVKERESEGINKQAAEPDEPVKDITEVIELARKAGRLSSIHELNQYIMNITEGLLTEIDRRRRVLRRIEKAIELELEFVKNSDITCVTK
jgi:DNA-binding NarL/FixJ family response regulator